MEMVEDNAAGFFPRRRTAWSESRLTVVLLLCLAFSVFAAMPSRAASFTASLDRDTIALGEQATLSLAFEGGQSKKVPTPKVPGLQIAQTGTSQNVSIINGAMSSTVTVTFSVIPQQTGEFTIPEMTADVNGQTLTSHPLKLTVLQAAAPSATAINSGGEVAFMRLSMPQKKVYIGQTFAGQLEIYLRDDVQNFGNFQTTSTPADGFTIGKNAEGAQFRRQIGNRVYTVIPLSVALTVTRTGNISLGPFTASIVVLLPSQNQGGDPFAMFFNRGEQKQVPLATDKIELQSLPLPDDGKPAGFNDAVGNYTLAVTAGPTNLAVGDPITLRVQIAGQGNWAAIKSPLPTNWTDFKLFPPTSKLESSDPLGINGTKNFEEIVTPQNSDVRELPQISFSFFNPDDGKYHVLNQPATPLAVHPAGSTPPPIIAAARNNSQETAQDILPTKENLGTLMKISAPLISQPAFLAVQTVPVLAFLAAFVWRKRVDHLANNPRLRRQRAVAALIASGSDDLKKYAAENKPDEFFATLFRLLQEQLGERLDCPASAITENVVDENSILRTAPETTRTGLREQFQLCNQARYAPVRGTAELNSVAAQFEKLIGQLKELKG